jgi:6-phosphofructo-2-kinase/fructose-2,6-biphosphatase 2
LRIHQDIIAMLGLPFASNPSESTLGAGVGGPSSLALYDATNSTKERRAWIYERCSRAGVKVFFIENICNDMNIIMKNIQEVKISSPDYAAWDQNHKNDMIADFQKRIFHYENAYETLSADELGGIISFVKVLNIGEQVILNRVQGYLESRIVYFLMNLNTASKSFIISRHGESMYNLEGKIGGNSDLSPQGKKFAELLPNAISKFVGDNDRRLVIWTSTLKRFSNSVHNRTIQSSMHLDFSKLQWKQLDELSSGACDGLTYEEIEKEFPLDFADRDNDKFNYRYHGGESYRDLVHRLEPVILELERSAEISF